MFAHPITLFYFVTAVAFVSSLICYYYWRREKRLVQVIEVLQQLQKDLLRLDARLIACKLLPLKHDRPLNREFAEAIENVERMWQDAHDFIHATDMAVQQSNLRKIEPLVSYIEQVFAPEDGYGQVLDSWRSKMDANLSIIEQMILEHHQARKFNA